MSERPWFQQHRSAWILESLEIFGAINREHIMKKFNMSVPQASKDLRALKEAGLIEYDPSAKVYRLKRETG